MPATASITVDTRCGQVADPSQTRCRRDQIAIAVQHGIAQCIRRHRAQQVGGGPDGIIGACKADADDTIVRELRRTADSAADNKT